MFLPPRHKWSASEFHESLVQLSECSPSPTGTGLAFIKGACVQARNWGLILTLACFLLSPPHLGENLPASSSQDYFREYQGRKGSSIPAVSPSVCPSVNLLLRASLCVGIWNVHVWTRTKRNIKTGINYLNFLYSREKCLFTASLTIPSEKCSFFIVSFKN